MGAKAGHEKAGRGWVEHPNKVIEVWVDRCEKCRVNLLDQVPERTLRRQVTEAPEIKPVVIELRQHEVRCPLCWGRQSHEPVCHLAVGLLQEALYWLRECLKTFGKDPTGFPELQMGRRNENAVAKFAVKPFRVCLFRYFLSGGKLFNVEEQTCIAMGDRTCTIMIDKSAVF